MTPTPGDPYGRHTVIRIITTPEGPAALLSDDTVLRWEEDTK